ncbi:MAG: deoxyhypusine synthase [Candidatus Methanofastidiosia archaeon]
MKIERIEPFDLEEGMKISDLISQYERSVFGALRLSKATKLYLEMLKERSTIFLGLAGALVPAGFRKLISDLIEREMIHILVSTGANLTHDLIEAFGGRHLKGISLSDEKLREKGIDRIYDAFLEDSSFEILENNMRKILEDIHREKKKMLTSEFLFEIGRRLKDKNSILRQAFLKRVPVFVPALSDSMLGLQTFLFSQEKEFFLDEIGDVGRILELSYKSKKTGALILGGGVPKNFILQTMLLAPKGFDYAIQITTDSPNAGGLSGATMEEAISWGKLKPSSKFCTLYCDATIAFPLMVAYVMEKFKR